MADGLDYLVEAIVLRAKEDYMHGKPGGHVEKCVEFDVRSAWWREVILIDSIDPEDIIRAWRAEKAALNGTKWKAPKKEYSKTIKDTEDQIW